MTRLLRVDDATLAAFAVRSGSGRDARAALGAELDAGADVLLLGDLTGPGPDRTAAAGALLAITQRVVVVPIIAARQHPINLGRNIATLSNLHGRRIGLAGTSASVLALISRLFESWPLDAIIGDTEAGAYVDDSRIVRISDPGFPSIGGPLTVPVDVTDKPVTVLLGSGGAIPGVDVVLAVDEVPVWGAVPVLGDDGDADAVGARAAFGLGASEAIAVGTPAFAGSGRFDQV
ncbi:hypothetical protein [Microbacterium sp. NPDC090003]|uniref:hypothetical protein n=1 Tax=Microbacterium sp. NPDC090003 TaxID=3364203 RepID=UPI003822432F